MSDVGLKPPERYTERLLSNGVLREQTIAAVKILRFQLDPIAEYLVAIETCKTLGQDELW
jgi:hypothetical protein